MRKSKSVHWRENRINLSRQGVSSEPPDSLLPFGIGAVGAIVCPTSQPPLT